MTTSFIFRVVTITHDDIFFYRHIVLDVKGRQQSICYKMIFYCFTALSVFKGHMIDS